MTDLIPAWFEDNFVNVEDLFVQLLTKMLPAWDAGIWTPDSWLDNASPGPMLTVIRLPGGHVDVEKGYDECLVQISAISGDRNDSCDAMSVIRASLLPMQGFKFTMDDEYTAFIHCVNEASGPQMLTAQQQLDVRVVPATFHVRLGMKSRARYDRILRSL